MKKYFYGGVLLLAVFEILNVYFIMPMPGSQDMNSVGLAYFLYSNRWIFRLIFTIMILSGLKPVFTTGKKWKPIVCLVLLLPIIYLFNFQMTADKMFLQAKTISLLARDQNKIPGDRLVIGVVNNGEAKAYPVEFLAYHHQVLDSVGGSPVMVTYCSVCRTGRVYSPVVDGHYETFRLVGMDHFNAMFEDQETKSWWRQSNGEAVAGDKKGAALAEVPSVQLSVDKWFELYPAGKVMQPAEGFADVYDPEAKFEKGKNKGRLTGTDSLSWKNKSWVLGVKAGSFSKAYDWNDLKRLGVINDTLGNRPIAVVLASDGKSFAAFERNAAETMALRNDTLFLNSEAYDLSGRQIASPEKRLRVLPAYQEFWHSWAFFHPGSQKYAAVR